MHTRQLSEQLHTLRYALDKGVIFENNITWPILYQIEKQLFYATSKTIHYKESVRRNT